MNRQYSTFVVALLVVVSAVAPASAALTDDESPSIETAERYGQPSFVVSYENESLSDLRTWENASDDRYIVSVDPAVREATVAAPRVEVDAGLLDRVLSVRSLDDLGRIRGSGLLSSVGYVEDVQPNYLHSYADPIRRLDNESNASTPQEGVFAFNDPEYPLDGVAYDGDANTTYMAESRDILGVDNVSSDVDGSGVLVANIDTGTNTAGGKVFQSRISSASKNFITNTTVNESGWGAISDGAGHGTWTSAAVAANTSNDTHDGVTPNAQLLVLKALADDGSGSTSDIARAIRYSADQEADVITMSLGSPVYDQVIVDAIEYAYANGVKVVTVAAGNSRQVRSPGIATPGDAANVITVGATNGSEPPSAASAYFSQYGPDTGAADLSNGVSRGASIDVVAPGMATVARVPVEDSSRTTTSELSGTSMATPMVAGGAALLVDAHPDWEKGTYREWIRAGAVPVPNAAASESGHGMFNAQNAISKTDPEREQTDAMTPSASARNDFHRTVAGDTDHWFSLAATPQFEGAT